MSCHKSLKSQNDSRFNVINLKFDSGKFNCLLDLVQKKLVTCGFSSEKFLSATNLTPKIELVINLALKKLNRWQIFKTFGSVVISVTKFLKVVQLAPKIFTIKTFY